MSPKKMYYFIGKCLSLDEHPKCREFIQHSFFSGEVSPEAFISFCDSHLILQAIYLSFKKHNLLQVFAKEYVQHIAAITLRNKQRNFEILKQVDEINQVLNKEDVETVYLKGTGNLLDNLYSDVGERMIGDIDLLVQEKDYLKAAELIMQQGYQTDRKTYSDITTSKHYPRLFRTDVPADIEIHRIPVNIEFSKQFNSEIIFHDKKQIPDKVNCFVPSDQHKAIHSFIHAQLSNLGYLFKQTPLRDLFDMYLLSKRTVPTSLINQAEEKRKLTSYLIFTNRIFDTRTNQEIKESSASRRYIKIHDWFLNHPKIHRWYILTIKLIEVVFVRFFRGVGKIFIAKSWSRFFTNIADPGWYKMIIYRIKNFYRNYISGK